MQIAFQMHRLARHSKTQPDLGTDRNQLEFLRKRFGDIWIPLVSPIMANLLAQQAGTDSYTDLSHN